MNFQVTVLKILVSYPDGFAVMADLKRDMAILATSGCDWAERTKRLAARVLDLDIFSRRWSSASTADGGSPRRAGRCSTSWKPGLPSRKRNGRSLPSSAPRPQSPRRDFSPPREPPEASACSADGRRAGEHGRRRLNTAFV